MKGMPETILGTDGSEVILLVEDEEDVRALVREVLEGGGYAVLEAEDGRQAIRVADHCCSIPDDVTARPDASSEGILLVPAAEYERTTT